MADAAVSVDPKEIRFTAASILVSFQGSPLKDRRIDKTVDLLLSEDWPSRNCPILPVIRYENTLWSLQNQWLWVYRKAKFLLVDVLVLDPGLEPLDAFLAAPAEATPDVVRFLALLKKPQQMARMRSEMFFPVVRGDWEVHHSDELIDAIRTRRGEDGSLRAPNAVPKFELSSVSPCLVPPMFEPRTAFEGDENATLALELESPQRSEQCRVMGLRCKDLKEPYVPKLIAMAKPTQASPLEHTQKLAVLMNTSDCSDRYAEAVLAVMSAATMHGLTFTVPFGSPAVSNILASSASNGDAPVATLTGFFVP